MHIIHICITARATLDTAEKTSSTATVSSCVPAISAPGRWTLRIVQRDISALQEMRLPHSDHHLSSRESKEDASSWNVALQGQIWQQLYTSYSHVQPMELPTMPVAMSMRLPIPFLHSSRKMQQACHAWSLPPPPTSLHPLPISMVGERNAKSLWHMFMPSLGIDTHVGSHQCAANCVTCPEHLVEIHEAHPELLHQWKLHHKSQDTAIGISRFLKSTILITID